jgi:hypothetical protein
LTTIRAELTGSNTCTALGVTVRANAPVLEICRVLVAADHGPTLGLEAWRGDVLCLRVRSIGEAAGLTVEDNRHGTPVLRRRKADSGVAWGPPVAPICPAYTGHRARGRGAL